MTPLVEGLESSGSLLDGESSRFENKDAARDYIEGSRGIPETVIDAIITKPVHMVTLLKVSLDVYGQRQGSYAPDGWFVDYVRHHAQSHTLAWTGSVPKRHAFEHSCWIDLLQ